jgi:hypothetical protein
MCPSYVVLVPQLPQVLVPPVHTPDWHESVEVQALASSHVVPFVFAGFEQSPVLVLHVPARWHWSEAVHVTGLAPVQVPFWQESTLVQVLPSLQPEPFVFAGFEQLPVWGLQVPALWHWSWAVHVTGFEPVQVPLWHASFRVQALPSSQGVAFALGTAMHVPFAGSQLPVLHALPLDEQSTGVPATHVSAEPHVSSPLQGLPSSQSPASEQEHAERSAVQPPSSSEHESVVQAMPSSHVTLPPRHTPSAQASSSVHRRPSSHAVPSAFGGSEQAPLVGYNFN